MRGPKDPYSTTRRHTSRGPRGALSLPCVARGPRGALSLPCTRGPHVPRTAHGARRTPPQKMLCNRLHNLHLQDKFPYTSNMNNTPSPPVRKRISHIPPLHLRMSGVVFFVTICAEGRTVDQFIPKADILLACARHYQHIGRWFIHLFLIMPDHLHMLVQVPSDTTLTRVMAAWKHYLSQKHGIRFQREIFETRIRDEEHFMEKWRYILYNPVTRGLVAEPRDWPHVISFNAADGLERVHRGPRQPSAGSTDAGTPTRHVHLDGRTDGPAR